MKALLFLLFRFHFCESCDLLPVRGTLHHPKYTRGSLVRRLHTVSEEVLDSLAFDSAFLHLLWMKMNLFASSPSGGLCCTVLLESANTCLPGSDLFL